MNDQQRNLIQLLLRDYGVTFAEEAGIVLHNEPDPLFQLLVLSLLLNAPLSSGNAVRAARALRLEGLSSARKMADSTWEDRLEVLKSHGYQRYGEETATRLGGLGERVLSRYQGDLRKLEEEACGDTMRARKLLLEFVGVGSMGASIFLREVQAIWPKLTPVVDKKLLATASELGLIHSNLEIAHLVPRDEYPKLLSALVRVWRDDSAGDVLRSATV